MKLADLEPKLYRLTDDGRLHEVETTAEAGGVMFLCPGCFVQNAGNVGTHSILLRIDAKGEGPRWAASGSTVADLTLKPSVNVHADRNRGPRACPGWHGFITNGEVRSC